MAKASIAVNGPASPNRIALEDDPVSLVFEALAEAGVSEKEAAFTMAVDRAQLSRMKSRQARLTLDAIWRLPDGFWLEFQERTAEAKGLTPADASRVRRRRIRELALLLFDEAAS